MWKIQMTCTTDVLMSCERDIVLPVAALLKQYKEHPDSTMIRHFDLMFIQQSINKLTSKVGEALHLDHCSDICRNN